MGWFHPVPKPDRSVSAIRRLEVRILCRHKSYQSIKHNAGIIGHYFTGVWHRGLLRMHSRLMEKTADRVSEDIATLAVSPPVSLVLEKVPVKALALRAIQ